MAESRPDTVISFKIPAGASERLEEIAKAESERDIGWRKPMSRHQMARAIVLKSLLQGATKGGSE